MGLQPRMGDQAGHSPRLWMLYHQYCRDGARGRSGNRLRGNEEQIKGRVIHEIFPHETYVSLPRFKVCVKSQRSGSSVGAMMPVRDVVRAKVHDRTFLSKLQLHMQSADPKFHESILADQYQAVCQRPLAKGQEFLEHFQEEVLHLHQHSWRREGCASRKYW